MNYATMPAGPEMDRMIAEKVMGWSKERPSPEPLITLEWQRFRAGPGYYRDFCGACGYDGCGETWAPSKMIAHAWEVVEKLRTEGFVPMIRGPGIFTVGDGYYKHDRWHVAFQSGAIEAAAVYEKEGCGYADTPMHAICRAALIAVLQ